MNLQGKLTLAAMSALALIVFQLENEIDNGIAN